jgi:integrase
MRVSKSGKKTWRVRWRDGGREAPQQTRTFDDFDGAEVFARLVDQLGGAHAIKVLAARANAGRDIHTVESWANKHIDTLSGVQEDTIRDYRRFVSDDLGLLAPMPLDAVVRDDIAAWVRTQERHGSSGKTIANKHGFVSGVFNHAVESELISSNPCRRTRLPRTVEEPMTILTHSEFARFLVCFDPYWQPLVTALFGTGMRWGEITALRCSEVDVATGTIHVIRAVKRSTGEGAPKTRRGRRTLAVSSAVIEALRPLVEGQSSGEYVFRNKAGNRINHTTFWKGVWAPAVKRANGEPAGTTMAPLNPPLGKRIRIHDARHTCASWLLGDGVPINYVQAHLGHESITTTVNRYGHIMPDAQRRIREALDAALGGH